MNAATQFPYSLEQLKAVVLPVIVTAGQYALNIQNRVRSQPAKDEYDTLFAQAVTDADLAVQNFFEVALLAHLPKVSFFGEENEQSLSSVYFPDNSGLELLLDPIDGTRFYADGKPDFNVVLSAVDKEWYQAAFLYLPAKGVLLYVLEGEPARILRTEDMQSEAPDKELSLSSQSRRIITYRCPEVQALVEDGFEVIDIDEAYEKQADCPNVTAMLLGEAAAFVGRQNSAIDWGVQAYLAANAGGRISDWQGRALPTLSTLKERIFPEMVVSADEQTHRAIIKRLTAK